MSTKSIKLPMYIGNFHMHKLESKSDFAKMKKKHEKNMPKNFNDYDGFVFYEKDNYHVVFRKIPTMSVISHEVVHLVNAVFIEHQIELDLYNDEPQAYLHGWFVKQIDKFLKKSK